MNKINYVQNGISLLTYKTPKSFNFANLGLVTPSGKIIFSNEECALRYAKNSVVKALNGEKPFERGFVIQNSTVFAKSDGNASSVVIQRPSEGKYYTVHGHPDEYMEIEESTGNTLKDKIKKFLFYTTYKKEKNGIALPISIQDYRILMCHPNETKEIVYNSKGEYSILEKTQPNQCMNEYEFEEIEKEYYLLFPCNIISELIRELKKFIALFLPAKKLNEQGIAFAKQHSQQIHEFLLNNTKGLIYRTNYSHLKHPE